MTNQASEDELEQALYLYGDICAQHQSMCHFGKYTVDERNLAIRESAKDVLSIIRTEKLKLLAEVRERVVGEDKPLQGKYRASGLMSYDMTNHYENSLRAEQRAVLTKLEAEL